MLIINNISRVASCTLNLEAELKEIKSTITSKESMAHLKYPISQKKTQFPPQQKTLFFY